MVIALNCLKNHSAPTLLFDILIYALPYPIKCV